MSRMGELVLEIDEMLYAGHAPETIASVLQIPLEWVIAQEDILMQELELEKQYEMMSRS
jgi:hypothetical protein